MLLQIWYGSLYEKKIFITFISKRFFDFCSLSGHMDGFSYGKALLWTLLLVILFYPNLFCNITIWKPCNLQSFFIIYTVFIFTFGPYELFVDLDVLQTTWQHIVLLLTVDHRSRVVFQRNIKSACEVNIRERRGRVYSFPRIPWVPLLERQNVTELKT